MDRRTVLLGPVALPAAWLLALSAREAAAGDPGTATIEKFYGEYVGEAVTQTGEDFDKRSINAKIRPVGAGFEMTWTLVIEKQDGKSTKGENTFRFLPSKRPNLFISAMRTDMFGNAVPLDPMKGDPYLWARLDGPSLIIYALLITEEGGYEIQTYERTLQPGGLALKFNRLRDGKVKRTIAGTLRKVK